MTNTQFLVLIVVIVLIAIYWERLKAVFSPTSSIEGTDCTTTVNGVATAGSYVNGVCVPAGGPGPTNVVERLSVINYPSQIYIRTAGSCATQVTHRGRTYVFVGRTGVNCVYQLV